MSNELYLAIMYFIFFIIFAIITTKILLALNFEKMFNQGKIIEIRVAFIFSVLIISYLMTKCLIEFAENILVIING